MDCLTAQTKITSYVEGELSDDELKEFLIHMEKCSGCKEELEIYYTLLEATRQLDQGVITTSNFSQELENKIHRELEEIRHIEKLKERGRWIFSVTLILFLLCSIMEFSGATFPFLMKWTVTWEDEKSYIEESMIPYMFDTTFDIERLDIK